MSAPAMQNYSDLCGMIATKIYGPLAEKFQIVSKVAPAQWNFFVSLLAFRFFIDVMKSSGLSLEEQHDIFLENCNHFKEQYPDFVDGFKHLSEFMDEKGMGHVTAENLGFWLATNLFDKTETNLQHDEIEVATIAAKLAMVTVSGWLKTDAENSSAA